MIPHDKSKDPLYASLVREIENSTFDVGKIERIATELFDKQPDILQFQSIDSLLRSYTNKKLAIWGVLGRVDKIMQERILARVRKGLIEEELSKLFTQLHSISNSYVIYSIMTECSRQYPFCVKLLSKSVNIVMDPLPLS